MPPELNGYVLAGGKSSRMGRDKALLELDGQPLVARAVEKLRQVCSDVFILSSREELAEFGTLVPDVHPECGPLGGMEAALLHSSRDWNLFLPVDMPFVPVKLMEGWAAEVMSSGARIALFLIGSRPQPTFCLLHREVLPWLERAVKAGEFKLLSVLEGAGRDLAPTPGQVLWTKPLPDGELFANLNTPEEFAVATRLKVE